MTFEDVRAIALQWRALASKKALKALEAMPNGDL